MRYNKDLYGVQEYRVAPSLSIFGKNNDHYGVYDLVLVYLTNLSKRSALYKDFRNQVYIDLNTGDWVVSELSIGLVSKYSNIRNIRYYNNKIQFKRFSFDGSTFEIVPKFVTASQLLDIAYPFCSISFGEYTITRWIKILSLEMYDVASSNNNTAKTTGIHTPQELKQILQLSRVNITFDDTYSIVDKRLRFNALSIKDSIYGKFKGINLYKDLFGGKIRVNSEIDRRISALDHELNEANSEIRHKNLEFYNELSPKEYYCRQIKRDTLNDLDNKIKIHEVNHLKYTDIKEANCELLTIIKSNVDMISSNVVGYRLRFLGNTMIIGSTTLVTGSIFTISHDFLSNNFEGLKRIFIISNASFVNNGGSKFIRVKPGFKVDYENQLSI